MESTPDQVLKIENYTAQYNSILGRIRDANLELERVNGQIKDKTDELSLLLSSLSEVREDGIRMETVVTELDAKKRQLEKEIDGMNEDKVHIKSLITRMIASYEKTLKALAQDIKTRERKIENLSNTELSLKDKNDKLQSKLEKERQTLNSLTIELNDRKISFKEETRELEAGVSKLSKEVDVLEKCLVALRVETKKEEEKIGMADRYIKKKEEEFKRRERDIQIVTARLKKLFQEVKPGVDLKI